MPRTDPEPTWGYCPSCRTLHPVGPAGGLKRCGALGSVALGLASRRPLPALLALAACALWGDRVERWVRDRCPECGVALRVLPAST